MNEVANDYGLPSKALEHVFLGEDYDSNHR